MNKRVYRLYLVLAPLLMLLSCKDQYSICDLNKDVFFKAGFYKDAGGTDVINNAPICSLAPLNKNYIYFEQQNIASFTVSLNPLLDSNRYYIQFSTSLPADTLTLVYTTRTEQLSVECGNISVHTLTRSYSTGHTIDSVKIKNPEVNTGSSQNIRIYF